MTARVLGIPKQTQSNWVRLAEKGELQGAGDRQVSAAQMELARLRAELARVAAGNFPRHRTICDFRAFHLKELSELFVQVVKLAREMGLVKLGTVAIDGTKVKANASRHKATSYERMKLAEAELKAQIDALLARAKATDEAEAGEPELDLPAEIERREVRLAAIREARERLEQRQREADLERGRSDDDDRRPRGPDDHGRWHGAGFRVADDEPKCRPGTLSGWTSIQRGTWCLPCTSQGGPSPSTRGLHMQSRTITALATLTLGAAAGSAVAAGISGQGTWETTLSARNLDGNWANGPEAYYDSQLDITWLANPKALAGTKFDTYFRGGGDDEPSDNESNETDGRAVLSDAFFWVTQLKVGSVSGWRLPTAEPINGSFYRYAADPKVGAGLAADTPWNGQLDVGWNITSTHSEMAHMFHVTLGNLGAYDSDGRPRSADEISFNTGVFDNLRARKFWSGSKYRSDLSDIAWILDFATGKQQGSFTELPFPEAYYAWAVHDGDVGLAAPVPEPAGWASLLLGLSAVGLVRRRRARADQAEPA